MTVLNRMLTTVGRQADVRREPWVAWVPSGGWRPLRLSLIALMAAACLGAFGGDAAAQTAAGSAPSPVEPDPQPFLMLDAGMHTGLIYRMSVDGEGDLLATGSTDKSIRLWNLKTGRALRKIHLPLGDGTKGEVTAVALSPSGTYLAASTTAFDTRDAFEQGDVHVIRVEDGKTIGRLSGFRSTISHLEFAPDSSTFAAILGAWGVQIWASNGRSLFNDHDISDPYVWLDYAPDGRLTAATRGGQLRRYAVVEGDRVLLEQIGQLPEGSVPYSIAYSPDGLFLAVGYADRPRVDVLDGDTFELITSHAPTQDSGETSADPAGNLGAVAWSLEADGSPWLYAAGSYQDENERNLLMAWPYGHGARRTLAIAENSITHLHPVPGGGVVYASTEPSWGRVSVDPVPGHPLSRLVGHKAPSYDFREAAASGGMVLASDASRVWVKPRTSDNPEVGFDLRRLSRIADSPPTDGHVPSDARGGTEVDDWYAGADPRINGKPLTSGGGAALFDGERTLSVDISADGRSVLVGTDYFLRLFDNSGRETLRRRLSTPAWAVALAPRGDLAVAALGDGTVRWYAITDGLELEEIGAVFQHVDGQRWAAWTADGRFAHSDYGGASLVGYQFNGTRANLTGRWVSFANLYRVMYAPNVVASLLDDPAQWSGLVGGDLMNTLPGGLQLPSVTLTSLCTQPGQVAESQDADPAASGDGPADGSAEPQIQCGEIGALAAGFRGGDSGSLGQVVPEGTSVIEIRVRTESGVPETIDTFVNGRNLGRLTPKPATQTRGATASGDAASEGEMVVSVPVSAGENRVVLRSYGPAGVYTEAEPVYVEVPVSSTDPEDPVLHVLAVGVDAYTGGKFRSLNYAVKDAEAIVGTLHRLNTDAPLYNRVAEPVLLTNGDATREAILAAIADLAAEADEDDSVVIYLGGHGVTDEDSYFYVNSGLEDMDDVRNHGLNQEDMTKALSRIVARNVILLLDTCYSGEFRLEKPDTLAHETGRFVLTAAKSDQEALDKAADVENGVFTHAVVQGLNCRAAFASAEHVDALGLGLYVRGSVRGLAQKAKPGSRQDAVFKAGGGDLAAFPLVPIGAACAQ